MEKNVTVQFIQIIIYIVFGLLKCASRWQCHQKKAETFEVKN